MKLSNLRGNLISFLCCAPPALLVKKKAADKTSVPLRVDKVDVDVKVLGNTATTTVMLEFKNDTSRVLEGELVIPLAEGMSVSGYALEVNGKMRQGVVVEKARARQIFESIVRQQIDPGLVEWTKGNNFKTRIYPIPANGAKKVQVSYQQVLKRTQEGYLYRLPIAYSNKLSQCDVDLRVHGNVNGSFFKVLQSAGLNMGTLQHGVSASQKNHQPKGALEILLPVEHVNQVYVHQDKKVKQFLINDRIDLEQSKMKPIARKNPSSVLVVWDASNSGAQRDVEKELHLLNQYLKSSGVKQVHLLVLNNKLNDWGLKGKGDKDLIDVSHEEGRSQLVKLLKGIPFDGATRLNVLDLAQVNEDAVLFFSDGVTTLGQKKAKAGNKPIFTIHAAPSASHGYLGQLAKESQGAYINLNHQNANQAMHLMTTQQLSLIAVKGKGVKSFYPSLGTPVRGDLNLIGHFSEDTTEVELVYGIQGKPLFSSTHSIAKAIKAQNEQEEQEALTEISRMWAQLKLDELAIEGEAKRDEIVKLGKQYGIVTPFTSLLVLDRIQDYIEHQITPPEEDLHEAFEKGVQLRQRNARAKENNHLQVIKNEWNVWKQWHKKEHLTAGQIFDSRVKSLVAKFDTMKQQVAASSLPKDKRLDIEKAMVEIQKLQVKVTAWGKKNNSPHDGPDAEFKELEKTTQRANC